MKSKTVKRGVRLRVFLASLVAVALGIGQAIVGATAANAADISGQINVVSATFIGEDEPKAGWGQQYQLKGTVAVPDSANPGDSWTWQLPSEIMWPAGFNIDIGGTDVVNVTIANNVATFTLTDAGANTNALRVNFEFGGQLDFSVQPGDYDLNVTQLGATIATKHIKVVKPPFHELPTYDWKQMWFNGEQCRTDVNNCITAAITLKAGDRGMITVTDLAKPNWRFACDTMDLTLRDHNAETETDVTGTAVLNKVCSPESLQFNVDTTGLPAHQSYRMTINLNATVPSETGLVTYENDATITDRAGSTDIHADGQSAYVGGFADGAHIKIRKTDAAGNDANTQATGIELPGGKTQLVYAIINNGTQDLTQVEVSDVVKVGNAKVTNLECVFPDDSKGTSWAGPFKPKQSFRCTADLDNVFWHHQNVGKVAALSATGTPVKSEDPYWARNKQKVSVGNQVWIDENEDGLYQDTEQGIENVTLTVSRTDGQPVLAYNGDPYNTTTQTDAQGRYVFEKLASLPAGVQYVVTVDPQTLPADYIPTKEDVGGTTGVDNNSSAAAGKATSTDLVTNGAADMTLDFGYVYKPKPVSVGDHVWWDVNRNGLQDAGEAPVADVTVKLYDANGDKVAETTTNAEGFYSFVDLKGGKDYTIEFVKPDGTTFTMVDAGDDAKDSDAAIATGRVSFTAPADGTNSATNPDNPTIDAGLVKLNLVLVKKLETKGVVHPGDDVVFTLTPSNDGPVDALAGWSVTDVLPAGLTLKSMAGDGYQCDTATATCVADGILAAGATGKPITVTATVDKTATGVLHNVAYVAPHGDEIVETNPLGDKPTTNTNTDDTPTDNDSQADVTLAPLVSVGDYVWWDVNRDGLQDAGEAPVADVTVNLYDANGDKVAETKTNAEGFYSFVDLRSGKDYVIEFVKPDGTTFTMVDAGDDAKDSDAAIATGRVAFTAPASGNNSADMPDNPTIDAGLVKLNLVLVKKLETKTEVYPGDEVVFTLTPSNDGPVDALAGWSVTDVLPKGLTLKSMAGDGYQCDTATATCVADGILAAGATGKPITVTATVDYGVKGKLHNVAYVAPAKTEIVETNPLGDKPTTNTNTDDTPTDNDSQADVNVKPLVSVGDYVWWDVNRDGLQTDGEAPVADVVVNLYDANGDKIADTKTDEKGFYSFIDLKSEKEYTIEFVKPDGTTFTTQDADAAKDGEDSDADLATGKVTFTAPADGDNLADKPDNPTIDAGLLKLNLVLVKKLESDSVVKVGETVTFSLTPSNEGPVDALAGWSVTDVLPAGLTLVEISGEGYTCDTATATCVADGILAAGATGKPVTVKATVNAGVKGELHNVAYVEPHGDDIVETNPLGEKPTTGTNTDETDTDNDSQAKLNVAEPIVPGLAKTGGEMPLIGAGVAALLLLAGTALVVARRKQA